MTKTQNPKAPGKLWIAVIVVSVLILAGLLWWDSQARKSAEPEPAPVLSAERAAAPEENEKPSAESESAEPIALDKVVGQWLRTDGQYSIVIQSVNPDGTLKAEYFNPGPINVAEANVTRVDGNPQVFIKLQDAGYPGSTYTLMLDPEKDMLLGTYFQAAYGQTYQVGFVRAEEQDQTQ